MGAGEWIGIIVGILTIIGFLATGLIWYVRVAIRDEIAKATQPIQPGYRNGGESLADVAANVKRILDRMGMDNE